MKLNNLNNGQNINRMRTKMSESLSSQNSSGKLLNLPENFDYFNQINTNNCGNKSDLNLSYDHIYASNTENGALDAANSSCQTAESEVKFLKEWLILHLDLIQQQNDEILNKEKTILILQQENEMLKERISCMERGSPYSTTKLYNSHSANDFLTEDMTQDSAPEEDDQKHDRLVDVEYQNRKSCKLNNFIKGHDMNDNEKCPNNFVNKTPNNRHSIQEENHNLTHNNIDERSDINKPHNNSVLKFNENNFTISSGEFDPMKELKMNIRRKRLCSSSSALSNSESLQEEKRSSRKIKRRRKSKKLRLKKDGDSNECVVSELLKDDQVLTCSEQYVTQTGEVAYGLINEQEVAMEMAAAAADSASLEVPRWRVKVYTSCYTMEGTENLDDEVYNKRHSRLENDERRRKRWDVQRIREQRVIEKLKQRQERTGSGSRIEEQHEALQSLWPSIDDIRYLEVCDELPVSAFGYPVPHLPLSEFSLPWLNNPNRSAKKVLPRKSTAKRKYAKR